MQPPSASPGVGDPQGGGQKSYSEIAAELFALGHANSNVVAFSKFSIKSMLEG
jgi:hypothetical protein